MGVVRVLYPGIAVYDNDLGIGCWTHHYTAHPGRRGTWADSEAKQYAGNRLGARWRAEQEMDPSARPGESLYKGFVRERNFVEDPEIKPQRGKDGRATGWYHVGGIDVGPHAAVFACNRPSPTWAHPTQGEIPILVDGQWIAYSEVYEIGIATEAFRLRIYEEAMIRMGLRGWEPMQKPDGTGVITEIFGDPSGKQLRIDLEANNPTLPIRISIGAPKLDERLNDRVLGIGLLNDLWLYQRDCCGIRYYGRSVRCERCHVVGPSIPALMIGSGCPNLVREIQLALKPKLKHPDEESKPTRLARPVPQHAIDALRYLIVGGQTVIPRRREEARENERQREPTAWEAGFLGRALADAVARRDVVAVDFDRDLSMEAGDPDA